MEFKNASTQQRKGKGKGKSFMKGKRDPNDPFWTIPEFGKAIGDSRIVIFLMADFIQPTNPFAKGPLRFCSAVPYLVTLCTRQNRRLSLQESDMIKHLIKT